MSVVGEVNRLTTRLTSRTVSVSALTAHGLAGTTGDKVSVGHVSASGFIPTKADSYPSVASKATCEANEKIAATQGQARRKSIADV